MLGFGRFWIPVWNLVLLVAIVALGFGAKPAYRAYRAYRIGQNLQAARIAAEHEDWSTARDKAQSVLLARTQDFEAYRIRTRALAKLGGPDAYMAAAELFADPRASRADLLETLQMMAIQAPQAVALSAYASLPPPLLAQADFRAAITPLLVQRGELTLAEANLREVVQATDAPKVRLEWLRVLCCRPDASRLGEARRVLADLINDKAVTEALAGLLLLGEIPGGLAAGEPLTDLPTWLNHQPQATALHHLVGMNPSLEAQPEAAERVYQAAVARFVASDPRVLSSWLLRHGQAAMAANVLEAAAQTHPDAHLTRLHALLCLQHDPALAAALAATPDACDPVEIELVQAAFESSHGDRITADSAWTRALNSATFDTSRNRCIDIARAAESCGAKGAAENAWVAAFRQGWGPLPLYRDLLPIISALVAKGRSEDLLTMFRTLRRLEPHNLDLLNNFCYFALIHGALPPDQVATMLATPAGKNVSAVCQSTLMLADILAGRPDDALARLPQVRACKEVAPMMCCALEGCARILAGDAEAGAALLKEVEWRDFMSQERIVFRSQLAKFKNTDLPLPKLSSPTVEAAPDLIPAWRKAVERSELNRADELRPPLPTPRVLGTVPPTDH